MKLIAMTILFLLITSCTAPMPSHERSEPHMVREHNSNGGFIEACESLPGMLGDDC